MTINVTLNAEYEEAVYDVLAAARKASGTETTIEALAKLKLYCEIFMDLPMIKALHTDGI